MDELKTMVENLKAWITDLIGTKKTDGVDTSVFDQKVAEIEAKYAGFQEQITGKETELTAKDAEIEALTTERDTLKTEKAALAAEVSSLKALPVDPKTPDPDISDEKKPEHPFDKAAKEMSTKLF